MVKDLLESSRKLGQTPRKATETSGRIRTGKKPQVFLNVVGNSSLTELGVTRPENISFTEFHPDKNRGWTFFPITDSTFLLTSTVYFSYFQRMYSSMLTCLIVLIRVGPLVPPEILHICCLRSISRNRVYDPRH